MTERIAANTGWTDDDEAWSRAADKAIADHIAEHENAIPTVGEMLDSMLDWKDEFLRRSFEQSRIT